MTSPASDRPVLIPVANPRSAPALLDLATRLRAGNGPIFLLTAVDVEAPDIEVARARAVLERTHAVAKEPGVRVRSLVRRAATPASAVLDAIAEIGPDLVVIGWRGRSSSTAVFGELIDQVVGRSRVPLAVVRPGGERHRRILLPVSAEHLLPGGNGSLSLATELARRLRRTTGNPVTVLRTGRLDGEVPRSISHLSDRIHHDRRRTHRVVADFADPADLIVAAIAPTASGLRAATTHLAWAAPAATLLIAVDAGPIRGRGLAHAASRAGRPAPARPTGSPRHQRVVVTIRLQHDAPSRTRDIEAVLRTVGETDLVMSWWPDDDDRAHLAATVSVTAAGPTQALSKVMSALHDAPELAGADIGYELDRVADRRRTRLVRPVTAGPPVRGPSPTS